MSSVRGVTFFGALAVACATAGPVQEAPRPAAPPSGSARVNPACAVARDLVARADALVAEGRLRQASRAFARARTLCPDRVGPASAALKEAESELSRPTPDPLALLASGVSEKKAGRRIEGQRLLDRALSALERTTGEKVRILVPPDVSHGELALSPDGAFLLATPRMQYETDVLDTGTGQLRARVPSLGSFGAVLVRGGRSIATAGAAGSVALIDLRTGATERTLVGVDTLPGTLTADVKGERLVVSGDALVVWDLPSGRRLLELKGRHEIAFTSDGRRIAYRGWARVITVHDLDQQKPIAFIDPGGDLSERGLALSPDGTLVAMNVMIVRAGPYTEVEPWLRVHDTRTGKTITLAAATGEFLFTHTTPPALIRTDRQGLEVWDLRTRKARVLEIRCEKIALHSASGQVLCRRDGALLLVDSMGRERRVLERRLPSVAAGALAAGSPRAAVLHGDEHGARLRVLDLENSKSLLDTRVGRATSVALSVDGSRIALGGRDGAELRDARDGRLLYAISKPDTSDPNEEVAVRFRPDGAALAAFTGEAAHLIEATTGRLIARLEGGQGLAFSRDSNLVAHGLEGKGFRLADARSGEPRGGAAKLEQAGGDVHLAFSRDSRRVFVGGFRALREYDVAGRHPPRLVWYGEPAGLAVLPSHALAVAAGGLLRFIEPDKQVHHLQVGAEEVQANDLGLVLTRTGSSFTVLDERDRDRYVTLEAMTPSGALIARAPNGNVELLDPTARDALGCLVGAVVHPLELCEDELLTTGLIGSIARPGSTSAR